MVSEMSFLSEPRERHVVMKLPLLAVLLLACSCATDQHPNIPLLIHDWKADDSFSAKLELQESSDSYFLRLDMTSKVVLCVGDRQDGTPDMEAQLEVEDGMVVKGIAKRVIPEWSSAGAFRTRIEVTFPRTSSKSKAKQLTLDVDRSRETCSMSIVVR
jgi:hypothetical protein